MKMIQSYQNIRQLRNIFEQRKVLEGSRQWQWFQKTVIQKELIKIQLVSNNENENLFQPKESTLLQCFELTTFKESAQVNRFQWTLCFSLHLSFCQAQSHKSSGICQAVVRQSSGSRQEVVRHLSGSSQAVVRQSSGSHQGVVWVVVGQFSCIVKVVNFWAKFVQTQI